jgi:cellulose synthase operon protein C
MRFKSVAGVAFGSWLAVWPIAAHADYMSNARAAMKKGDLKSAQIDLRNAVRGDPQNAEAHFWLGRVALELGDPVAAEREAQAARERGFDANQALPLYAQALLAQNKFQQVLENLKPDGKDPKLDASILVFRGYAEVGLRRPEDAQKSFAAAEEAAPNAVEPLLADARLAVARADLAGAQTKIDRALAAQPKSQEALLAKSQLLRLKNDPQGALSVLDELITDQPSVIQARLDRASLELALNKNDAAKADIDVVLKATPGNVQAIYLTAVLEAQARNYKAADTSLERIASYVGRIQRGFYLLAVVKEQLGQLEQAQEAAQKYLGRAPNDLAAYKILARIQFAKRRPDQVIETLAKVGESGKGDAETYDLLGRAYAATNRGTEAIQAFQKAEAMAPNDVGLQTRLASVRMGMGDSDAAVGDLEHTLELAPKMPAVGEALFFAALATGDMKKAADALDKVRTAQGNTDVVQNLDGLFKLSLIDIPGAETVFSALVKKSPDFTPGKINLARVYAMEGRTADAEGILSDILAKNAATQPALTMLSTSYVQSNRLPLAITLMERAHGQDPANARITVTLGELYSRAGTPQKALDLANAEKGANAKSPEILGLRAAAQLALGMKKEARETYSDLLKQDNSLIGARRQMVALLVEAGDYESARGILTAGIAASPRNYQLYQDLVLIDLKSTGIDAAIATAERLMSQDRDFAAIRTLKGDVYMASNRPADAVTAYNEALKANPSTLLLTKMASAMLRANQVDTAIQVLGDWIKNNPNDLIVYEQLGEIHIGLNRLDDAKGDLEEILRQKPHDAVALNNLAWVYQQLGDNRAPQLAREAYVLAPGPQTADTLGWILATGGNTQAALPLLRQASIEASNDPRIVFHYGAVLKAAGNKDEAIKQLTAVVGYKAEFKEKAEAQKMLEEMGKGS